MRQRMWRLAPADVDPVVLRHSRIYILPTGRGAALMTTLVIMLLTAMNYALSLGYAFVFVVGGLAAAALLATFRNLAGVAVAPVAAGEAFAGGELAFTLSIASNARDRVGLLVAAQDGHAEVIDVPAAATRPASISITARRRGRRDLGRVTLSSDFPLGLWRAWSYVHFPLAGVVYPAPEAGAPPLPLGVRGSDSRRSAEASDAELSGVRDYQTGDPHNRVAWKAVARGAGWYTKQFEGSGGGGALTLDWSELPAALDAETRLSRLCAWVLAAEREARPFALHIPGTDVPLGQGAGHRRTTLAALALFPDAGAR
jgi:uncharacterized protein (DUF58 family)